MSSQNLPEDVIQETVRSVESALRSHLESVTLTPVETTRTSMEVARAAAQLRGTVGQATALSIVLDAAEKLGARAALFVAKDGHLEGWKGQGFDDEPTLAGILRGVRIDSGHPAVDALFSESAPVFCRMGGDLPVPDFGQTNRGEALLVPLVIQDKIAAMLYLDPVSPNEVFDRHGIEALAQMAALTIEYQALSRAAAAGSGSAPERSEAPASATPASGFELATGPEVQASETTPTGQVSHAPAEDIEVEVEIEMDGPDPEADVAAQPEVSAPAADASSSPEIEDARRFARLVVEEIRLYNEDQVESGKAHRDILARLEDEISRARAMYEQRVGQSVRSQGDFFGEALVTVLAGGDAAALGS